MCVLVCKQLEAVERNETVLNTITEKKLAHQLRDITEATTRLYGNDLQIAERLLSRLLTFEIAQTGFGLTATQDAHFTEVRVYAAHTLQVSVFRFQSLSLSYCPYLTLSYF